jgi:hypothetical protein
MNDSKWLRLAAAGVAGAVLTASSVASAQINPKRAYCSEYARNVCSVDEYGHPQQLTRECFEAAFVWCMSDFAGLQPKKLGGYGSRHAGSAPSARLR